MLVIFSFALQHNADCVSDDVYNLSDIILVCDKQQIYRQMKSGSWHILCYAYALRSENFHSTGKAWLNNQIMVDNEKPELMLTLSFQVRVKYLHTASYDVTHFHDSCTSGSQ